MKKTFKLFVLILIGAMFVFNFASCDDISFTYRRHQDKDKGGSQSEPSATTKSKYISNSNGTGTATLVSSGEYWDELNIPRYDLLGNVSSYDVVGIVVTLESGNCDAGVVYNSSQYNWGYTYTQSLDPGVPQTLNDVSFAYSGANEYNFKFYISNGTAGDTAKITWSVITPEKLNEGDIFVDEEEDSYLKVINSYGSYGYVDLYVWDEDTYSYEKSLSDVYYSIDNSKITINYSYYDEDDGNYYTDPWKGNFDGTAMTFFNNEGYTFVFTKVTSVPKTLKTATDFSTITLEDNYPYNNHAMIEWIASDNKYKLSTGQKIKFTVSGFTNDNLTINQRKFTAALVDTTPYSSGWRELSNFVNAQNGTTLEYNTYFEAVFIIELTSTPYNPSAEACKLELSIGEKYDTQSGINIYVYDFDVELLE